MKKWSERLENWAEISAQLDRRERWFLEHLTDGDGSSHRSQCECKCQCHCSKRRRREREDSCSDSPF